MLLTTLGLSIRNVTDFYEGKIEGDVSSIKFVVLMFSFLFCASGVVFGYLTYLGYSLYQEEVKHYKE